MTIDIAGLDKAEVLAALHGASRQQGMGVLQPDKPLTVDEARAILDDGAEYFDYVRGRVMKIALRGDYLDPRLYDRDNGEGAAARVIATLRAAQ